MLKIKIIQILFHTLVWCIFLLFPILVLPKPSTFLESDQNQLLIYFIIGVITIGFYYFSYFITIPNYLFKRKYLIFTGLIVVFIALSFILTRFFISLNFIENNYVSSGRPKLMGSYLFRFIIVFLAAFGFRFYQKLKQIETERIREELASLKLQINPHFLFNTLNGIYSLALRKSDKTAESVLKLSSMMRYVLTETTSEIVALENEINYITNYIELQKLRLTNKTTVDFTVNGNSKSKKIPPLLFINFIENAFKYGVSNEKESKIEILIFVKDESISLFVKNEKVNKNNDLETNKIGLANIKRRLELIYANDYELNIENTVKVFQVKLNIKQK